VPDLAYMFYTLGFRMTLLQRIKGKGYDFRKDFALRKALLAHELVPPELKEKGAKDNHTAIFSTLKHLLY